VSCFVGRPTQLDVLEVKASHSYYGDLDDSWRLTARDPGSSELLLYSQIKEGERPVAIRKDRLAALREAIRRERFFEFRDYYGELPVDGPERHMTIRDGARLKKVSVYSVWPDMKVSRPERAQIERALRVWIAIRNCFEAPGALDSRKDDRTFPTKKEKHPA
jgi:hypothetical protein